jgi:NADPH:quinone reductase-like Zn-dependent oxidoreductase
MRVRGTLSSSSLRARSSDDKAALLGELRTFVWPLFENGVIHPVTHATFTLEEAPEAHRLMESSEHIGKILLLA